MSCSSARLRLVSDVASLKGSVHPIRCISLHPISGVQDVSGLCEEVLTYLLINYMPLMGALKVFLDSSKTFLPVN